MPLSAGAQLEEMPCEWDLIAGDRAKNCPLSAAVKSNSLASHRAAAVETGSSPRRQGTLARNGCEVERKRFIPAQAGDTAAAVRRWRMLSVHPRAGGGHIVRLSWRRTVAWFIPAQAGDTSGSLSRGGGKAVHPRAGGGHATKGPIGTATTGSSPRRRGTPTARRLDLGQWRFIPAQAGDTRTGRFPARRGAVHPRAGGGHAMMVHEHLPDVGSSPRRRGTPGRGAYEQSHDRFIPAQAGDTGSLPAGPRPPTVHPRAGGGHVSPFVQKRSRPGSSPRRRGTLCPGRSGRRGRRFIPAQAGDTSAPRARSASASVHPRAGGGHAATHRAGRVTGGSSPRRRGTHDEAVIEPSQARFIPRRRGTRRPRKEASWSSRFIPAQAGDTSRPTRPGRG